jgi:EcsC family protein
VSIQSLPYLLIALATLGRNSAAGALGLLPRLPILRRMEATPRSEQPLAVREGLEAPPRSLWERIQADPTRAPEHVALAAAERFAPAAEHWAARMRHHHEPAELARIARDRHVRLSRLEGAVAGIGGALTAVPDVVALAWIQGRMVFFIAAAHGFDPHHPMRPAELLALQEIYATPAQAREALDGVGRPLAVHYLGSRLQRERALTKRLLKLAGRQVAKKSVKRVIPLLSVPVSSAQNARATGALGVRALAYYGGDTALELQ